MTGVGELEETRCVCCGQAVEPTAYKDNFNNKPLLYCQECGHIQIDECPTSEEIRNYYEGIYSDSRGSYIGDDYFRLMQKRATAQVEFVQSRIALANMSAYDIGSGYGFLLHQLERNQVDARGVDFDPSCIQYCEEKYGLQVTRIDSECELFEEGVDYDLVTMSHSLEHLLDVERFLIELGSRARYLFVEVPKYDIGVAGQFVDQEGHINFFTEKSLQKLLMRHGFKILALESFGPTMSLFWKGKYKLFRWIGRRVRNDYFFGDYKSPNKDGIWIRAIAEINAG
jgi:SAM-dependent methyltransferase